MRKMIIAANLKTNMTVGETNGLLDTFLLEIGSEKWMGIVIVSPFTALGAAHRWTPLHAKNALAVLCMKAKPHPKRAVELTSRGRSMRKKSPSPTAISKKVRKLEGSSVGIEVKSKRPPRPTAIRQTIIEKESSEPASNSQDRLIVGAVLILLTLLLAAAVTVIVLEKPQAGEAWGLIGTVFPAAIASLLTFRARRSAPPKQG